MAFDAEVAAIDAAVQWHCANNLFRHMVIHSDSTSAIARIQHSSAGPGQSVAASVSQNLVHPLASDERSAEILWVKGDIGSERADDLAGKAAEKKGWPWITSMTHLKLRISDHGSLKRPGTTIPNTAGPRKSRCHRPRNRVWTEPRTRWPVRQHRSAPSTGGWPLSSRGSGSDGTTSAGFVAGQPR